MIFLIWIITSLDNTTTTTVENRTEEGNQIWTRFSVIFYLCLPVVGLTLLWGRRDFFSKLQLQIDRRCVSVFCPSLSKREKLLRWASGQLPSTWASQARTLSSGIPELWKDGSLLCTLINSTIPGACPNPHRHWKKPPTHAQALAYKYLGLPPIFAESELSGDLTINQERNFVHYLHELQQAINKWLAKDETNRKFSSQYVARGMGLYTGEQYRKTIFYVYSNTVATKRQNSVLMYIRGPYGTKGLATIPPLHDLKNFNTLNGDSNNKILSTKSFMKAVSLDFTSLISGDNQNINDIQIQIEKETDRTKVTYIPSNCGVYEINLIVDGELLQGSPFNVHIIKNASRIKDTFDVDGDKIEEKVTVFKRKVLSKVIDCIDEKIIIDKDGIQKLPSSNCQSSVENETHSIWNCNENNEVEIPEESEEIEKATIKLKEIKFSDEPIPINQIIDEYDYTSINQQLNNNNYQESFNILTKIPDTSQNDDMTVQIITTEITDTTRVTNKISLDFPKNSNIVTSPICPDHIVPEVVTLPFSTLTAEDKRKQFSRQNSLTLSDTPVSSFSANSENGDNSKSDDNTFQKLSVLNILDTLKQTRRNSETEPFSLCSTSSLPNMTSFESCHENIFKSRKEYWERMSSCTSSSTSISEVGQNKKFPINRKNFFTKSCNKEKQTNKYNGNKINIRNSVDDLQKTHHTLTAENKKKFKSMDSSLEECTILSLAERKKMLLKNRYEQEIYRPKTKLISLDQQNEVQKNEQKIDNLKFIPISDRIQKFDKKKSPKDQLINTTKGVKLLQQEVNLQHTKKASIEKFKSSFKKAVNYFKNLEDNAKCKKRKENCIKSNRRYSLDCQRKNNENSRMGGSLNLPNISQRFAINNLYEDVIGHGKNSFKGTPNKSAVVDSLASFYNNFDKSNPETNFNQDDNIKFNLFVNQVKTKKRKSLKSLFDVNY